MPFWCKWQLALCIIGDFLGIKNLGGLNDLNSLNNLSDLNGLNSLISSKKLTEIDGSINTDPKMTYPGLLMWDGSLKIHYFVDFWHFFYWRLWRPRNIKKIKTDELGINAPNLWTCRIQKTCKNQYLYAHQSRITYHSLLWDTLYNI